MTTHSEHGEARFLLLRYERCLKCQQALNVEVLLDPLTHHYRIQSAHCPGCGQAH
jgi:hypothetical protein